MKPKVILYESIEQERFMAAEPEQLTDEQALARVLDLLDFNAALASQNEHKVSMPAESSAIEWIELKWASPV